MHLAATSERFPLFLQYVVDDIRDRHARGEPLAAIVDSLQALPAPFTEYAARQLFAMREMQRRRPGSFDVDVARVFALLTLVKGALPLGEFQEMLGARVNPWDLDSRITRWFASRKTGGAPTIAFLHPMLSNVFRNALSRLDSTAGILDEMQERLIGHCQESWSKGSLYALTNLHSHQIDADQIADAIATLADIAFLDARLRHASVLALIVRTMQGLEAADTVASPEQRTDTRPGRFFWATIEQRLLALAGGPQADQIGDALNQLLCDNPNSTERRHTAWMQATGHRVPPPLLRELKGHRRPVFGAIVPPIPETL